jgi:hypothetical protein
MRQVVENHETIIIEPGGKSHVVVLSVEEYERLLKGQQQGDWKELVCGARAQIQADLGGRKLPRPEEILEQVREERDEQLPKALSPGCLRCALPRPGRVAGG